MVNWKSKYLKYKLKLENLLKGGMELQPSFIYNPEKLLILNIGGDDLGINCKIHQDNNIISASIFGLDTFNNLANNKVNFLEGDKLSKLIQKGDLEILDDKIPIIKYCGKIYNYNKNDKEGQNYPVYINGDWNTNEFWEKINDFLSILSDSIQQEVKFDIITFPTETTKYLSKENYEIFENIYKFLKDNGNLYFDIFQDNIGNINPAFSTLDWSDIKIPETNHLFELDKDAMLEEYEKLISKCSDEHKNIVNPLIKHIRKKRFIALPYKFNKFLSIRDNSSDNCDDYNLFMGNIWLILKKILI